MVEYPKPIPELNTKELYDDVGFSASEKAALQNAWRVMKRRYRYHSFEIFLQFFTENEMLLERYRGPNGKFMLHSLNNHPLAVMCIFGELIEKGLDNPRHTNLILTHVVDAHAAHSVDKYEMDTMAVAVRNYMLDYLSPIRSPTLSHALEKLTDQIFKHYDGMENILEDRRTMMSAKDIDENQELSTRNE